MLLVLAIALLVLLFYGGSLLVAMLIITLKWTYRLGRVAGRKLWNKSVDWRVSRSI